jgi:predicted aldo/keto reductase-like oxidoreductase
MIIQGHIGSYWNGTQYERTRDLEKTKKGFEEMLRLLETDHIEVGMIHIVDKTSEWEEIENSPFMDYVKQLKAEGKIKHIGVSSHNVNAALAAVKSGLIEVLMFSLNPLFDRMQPDVLPWDKGSFDNLNAGLDPKRVELYNYCQRNNIAITVMKVFGGGGRLLKEDSPLGVKLTSTQCISYCLNYPCVATAICGAKNKEELLDDLKYLHATDAERNFTAAVVGGTDKSTEESNEKSTGCTYCNHCSPCPAGIEIAKVNELLDKAAKSDKDKAQAQAEYDKLSHHASECVGCGACEQRCPFGVPVRQRMKEAVTVFGE